MALAILGCAKKNVNIEKSWVDEAIAEFTEARIAHYLKGGAPISHAELFDRVLARRGLNFLEFRPALKRFEPQLEAKLFFKR